MDERNEELQYLRKRQIYRRKFDLILRFYSTVGLIIALISGAYFALTLLPFVLDAEQRFALIVSGTGIALALLSRLLYQLRKEREEEEMLRFSEYERIATFLDTWSQFEKISKEVLSKEESEYNKHSFRSVITRLYEENKIDKTDVLALEEALQTRNSIVHGKKPWSNEVTGKITEVLIDITKKIAI